MSLDFQKQKAVVESQYQAVRTAENITVIEAQRLVAVIKALGFVEPNVVIGAGGEFVSLQLADYITRGADLEVPVEVILDWPQVEKRANAATIYERFAQNVWSGFLAVHAELNPGAGQGAAVLSAMQQIPAADKAFIAAVEDAADKGASQNGKGKGKGKG